MARQTLHIFGHSESESSPYDSEVNYPSQAVFFVCDTATDLPSGPNDMDFALTKDDSALFFGNNGAWVKVKNKD